MKANCAWCGNYMQIPPSKRGIALYCVSCHMYNKKHGHYPPVAAAMDLKVPDLAEELAETVIAMVNLHNRLDNWTDNEWASIDDNARARREAQNRLSTLKIKHAVLVGRVAKEL